MAPQCLLLSLELRSDTLDSRVLQGRPLASTCAVVMPLLSINTTQKIQETVKLKYYNELN